MESELIAKARSASRRPPKEWDIPGVEPPEPTGVNEVVWLEPFPDALLDPEVLRQEPPWPPSRLRGRPSHTPRPGTRSSRPSKYLRRLVSAYLCEVP